MPQQFYKYLGIYDEEDVNQNQILLGLNLYNLEGIRKKNTTL